MKIKKNDKVLILAGKDRGKTGKVLQVFPRQQRASVEGINLLIKHVRPQRRGETGQRIEFPAPLHISNLQLICPQCGKASRVGYKYLAVKDGDKTKSRKARVCHRCQQLID
ncbi:50S ribosomal protein L24 [Candidatus Falkowbacteria bacterium]|jgi:large subunit ribosomal protein L24|nr:50S ribosomal protein L24 [Candidatus Falkowbacteria bacterium]